MSTQHTAVVTSAEMPDRGAVLLISGSAEFDDV